jgi:crotonobetainyl-CoA:carnitine CoA-transferase CaiB-like acyl-CoA transferase
LRAELYARILIQEGFQDEMDALKRFRVVEFAGQIAGPYCGKLLADAGADVVKVESGAGDPLRTRAVHGEAIDGDSALFRFLNAGKRSVDGRSGDEVVEALLDWADIIIESFVPAVLDVDALMRRNPALVMVSITPYGRNGSWADRPANDFIVQAEAGGLAGRGERELPPHQVGGRLTEWVAGTYAAVSAIAVARHAQLSGRGEWLDCAMIESANATFTVFSDLGAALTGAPLDVPPRRVERPSIEPTLDGWVGFNTNTTTQFENFLILIGREDLVGDPVWAGLARYQRPKEWDEIVRTFTRSKTTAEIVDAAAALRIPVAPVNDARGVLDHPQFRDRGVMATSADGDFVHPLPSYMIDGVRPTPRTPAPKLGEDTGRPTGAARRPYFQAAPSGRKPLEGLRVLDATGWWAGPSATEILACFGADVIHLESVSRLDGARTSVGAQFGSTQWWERAALYLGSNANKRSLTLSLDRPEGLALVKKLIATCDVVIENYSPRVFDNFGLSWPVMREINSRVIFVRMPAFGLSGPWRNHVGFAQTMEQISGMAWITGYQDGQPRIPLGPCDPNAGAHAAFALMVALCGRDWTGRGALVEASMAEAALNVAAEQVIVYSAHGITLMRNGNRSPDAAPQGLYLCAGERERWLAVSVENDQQWQNFQSVMGNPPWARRKEFTTIEGRRESQNTLDTELAAWARARTVDEAVAVLVAAGVPAGEARDPRTMREHPLLKERGYFAELEHPVVGRQWIPSPPFRPAGTGDWLRTAAPLLGQHNGEILRAMGLENEEIEALQDAQLIGSSPS